MRKVATWILTVLVAVPFLFSGYAKLSSPPAMIHAFQVSGYPQWFMYLTGALEIVSAAILFVPRFAFAGAGILVCVMIGAIASHVTHGQADKIGEPVALLVGALALCVLRTWKATPSVPPLRRGYN